MKTSKDSVLAQVRRARLIALFIASCALAATDAHVSSLKAQEISSAPAPQRIAPAYAGQGARRIVVPRRRTLNTIPNTSNRTQNAPPKNYNPPAASGDRSSKSGDSSREESGSFFSKLLTFSDKSDENAPKEASVPRSVSKSAAKRPVLTTDDSEGDFVQRTPYETEPTQTSRPVLTTEETNIDPARQSQYEPYADLVQRTPYGEETTPAIPQEFVPVTTTNVGAEPPLDLGLGSGFGPSLDLGLGSDPGPTLDLGLGPDVEAALADFAKLNDAAAAAPAPTIESDLESSPETTIDLSLGSDPELTLDLGLGSDVEAALADFAKLNDEAEAESVIEDFATFDPTGDYPASESSEDFSAFVDRLNAVDVAENASEEDENFGYFQKSTPSELAPEGRSGDASLLTFEERAAKTLEELEERMKQLDARFDDVVERERRDSSQADGGKPETFQIVASEETGPSAGDAEPEYTADARVPGRTRRVELTRERAAIGYLNPSATSSASRMNNVAPSSVFTSSAYGRSNDLTENSNAKTSDSLELDDVAEFAEELDDVRNKREDFVDDAIIDSKAFSADELELEQVDVETLKDECFSALDHYSSLFINYEPTYEWTEAILEDVDAILSDIESSPERARTRLAAFKERVSLFKKIKGGLERAARDDNARDPWQEDGKECELTSRYSAQQRVELLDAFARALERRAYVWAKAIEYFEALSTGKLAKQRDLTPKEISVLAKATAEVGAFFGDTPNGQSWRASFDVDALAEDARRVLELPDARTAAEKRSSSGVNSTSGYTLKNVASTPEERYADKVERNARISANSEALAHERARRVRFLKDRINAVAYKIEKTPMTLEQRRVFTAPTLAKWSALVAEFSGDQTNGLATLYAFERYELIGGGDAGASLQQLALRMTTSRSDVCRQFGRAFDAIYDNPNVKAYVSEALINRLLPVRDPEFAVVQERILDNPVVGTRRVDTQVSIQLIPSPNRLLMSLNVTGRAVANTSSSVFSAKLHNQSYVNYQASKAIEWRDFGVAYSPATVAANATNRLNAVETDVDFVPLVGDVAREITRSQFEARQAEIREETRRKTARETRERFDREANGRFDELNARLRANFFKNMSNLGLSLRAQRSRTTEDWLLASLRLGTDYSLGCQTTEPATLPGSFADFKLHESAVNAFLAQLELADRRFTPRELLSYLAVKLNKPQIANVKLDDVADVAFTFAQSDPIVVRFYEDQAQITLRFAKFELNNKAWEDVEVETRYRPTKTDGGAPALVRDGVVNLYGPEGVGEQIPLRAAFSKIFPANGAVPLRPELFEQDERFAGLALGLCRVSKGWFAISIVRDPNFTRERVIQGTTL